VINVVDLPKNEINNHKVEVHRNNFAPWGKAATIFQKMLTGFTTTNSLNKLSSINVYYNEEHPYYNLFNNNDQIRWKQPLGEAEFKNFLDSDARIIQPNELKQRIFEGGIDPKLRRIIWRFLLNIYPVGLTGMQRVDYIKSLSEQYYRFFFFFFLINVVWSFFFKCMFVPKINS
jgi:hypothetical protein